MNRLTHKQWNRSYFIALKPVQSTQKSISSDSFNGSTHKNWTLQKWMATLNQVSFLSRSVFFYFFWKLHQTQYTQFKRQQCIEWDYWVLYLICSASTCLNVQWFEKYTSPPQIVGLSISFVCRFIYPHFFFSLLWLIFMGQ